jgi:coenzyme F420-0:L-glutamate ligase/coenzyme F420-1:gamma-L-glutamate ligase
MNNELNLFAVPGMPLVRPGDDLARLIVDGLTAAGRPLQDGDVVVIAQKIVSVAEGRLVSLDQVTPSAQAQDLAETTRKDPRRVQVVLDDSRSVVRARPGLLIVEQRSGWICAHGGMDRSNVPPGEGGEVVALLPVDADASAECIRHQIADLCGAQVAVLINDSHGRPWRMGTVGICIGSAGLPVVWDQRGLRDLYGYELVGSEECIADELCSAASLIMGQSDEGRPVVVIRGYQPPPIPAQPATAIQRDPRMDVFR